MTTTKNPAKPSRMTSPAIRPTKSATCTNLSGQPGLTYEMGKGPDCGVYFRIVSNSGAGFFSSEWVSWERVYSVCSTADPLTSIELQSVYRGKSTNSAGFLLAALLAEGLVQRKPQRQRHYALTPAAHKLSGKGSSKVTSTSKRTGKKASPDSLFTMVDATDAAPA